MDDVDLAQEREEAHLAASMSARIPRLVSRNGNCIWCADEPIVAATAFCSAECGEDYHKHKREMKQRITGDLMT
ncbi:hypothetical protein PRCB_16640 [Pantoea rodasii]|uniref:DUF2116 family Zn-ribbon domain-containing protein n=1 Tax=Pantoea rodasii TaxID=1076549 RepID=A0A2M9WBX2_9GAMM|nr:DUF2116 family Zn-ribbon domain-containing protein [Pantoea rodasii]ORM64552.1 hypothetical protein HA45_09310 [Pantoea rodasii]PJZ05026.1 hypothetical protein PRCB_16640 [Pantoea rodasii]